ncbi:ABC-type transporter, integral membrane subunit [Spirochaeta thermophila DSM 6578]|uniref:ABC-type transporter, integral membrane subunit n=1 Tax=Winmispira thermophila (strain ATCC 700085 / DSM 6578 / Z-1203) TaxID=869211 RepID=G0GAH0_WINT7|nr:carbohydrate ABC transporter permease [Spirochaeta thermophila]AEJ61789.1 ABC-type transporter, integral membrane subunit [Spirochaeta thermophila DSM 6578]
MREQRLFLRRVVFTLGVAVLAAVYLLPLMYGLSMSLKTRDQIASAKLSILPLSPGTWEYEGKQYDLYEVPVDGEVRILAMIKRGRTSSVFMDPQQPGEQIIWEGNWRTLDRVWKVDPQWSNFAEAWKATKFPVLLKNTVLYAVITTFGTVLSSLLVAYGFARFSFPGKNVLFVVLMSTIILPSAVTSIPTYAMFYFLGWVGTWLPLMVPAFFSNAYNVFLLRQFLMGIPRELDEAARIDGAGPLRTLFQIIAPQATPAIIAVALFHFFFAWNDFFGPLIYLSGKGDLYPISIGLTVFNNMYTSQNHLIQAAALIASVIPLVVFAFAQRVFMQRLIDTGVFK